MFTFNFKPIKQFIINYLGKIFIVFWYIFICAGIISIFAISSIIIEDFLPLEHTKQTGAITIIRSDVVGVTLSSLSDSGQFYNCVVQKTNIKCWTEFNNILFPIVTKLDSGVINVKASIKNMIYNGCAIQRGALMCWNKYKSKNFLKSNVTAVNLSKWNLCAIQRGALKCWGDNHYGQLGNGTKKYSSTPSIVKGMESGVTDISLERSYACAIQRGALKCWGKNNRGQLGNGTRKQSLIPQIVKGMESGVTAISLMDEKIQDRHKGIYACAIQQEALKCWGDNYYGQLGNGTRKQSLIPQIAKGMESGVTAVSVGRKYVCAIQRGALKCWGKNNRGQLGNGTRKQSLIPQIAKGMELGVTAVSVSKQSVYFSHSCAIQRGVVKCTGDNLYDQLGNEVIKGSYSKIFVPVSNLESDTDTLVSSNRYSCATQQKALKCWGNNMNGQLGNGKREIKKSSIKKTFLIALKQYKDTFYTAILLFKEFLQ